MPTVIDSLFLELGIDTSKFSKDQQAALAKIAEFEKKSKQGANKAATAVKSVGTAFRDIADDSKIGSSAKRLDTFATKLKALGQAGQVSGGVAGPLGGMAEGLGALLSPATLGIAALGLLGAAAWDFNKKMTAANATIFRQAQLSDMSAKSLWSYGEAAKMVGANPQDVTGGIAGLQTAVMGMGIGAGNATAQLVALARLGVGWNFKTGVNIPQLFERVHQKAKAHGYQSLGALRALAGPLMNDAMWAYATSPNFDPSKVNAHIKAAEPANLGAIITRSLKSQTALGKLGIGKDIAAEIAYGGIQGSMGALVTFAGRSLDVAVKLLDWTINGVAGGIARLVEHFTGIKTPGVTSMPAQVGGVSIAGKLPADFEGKQALAMRVLMARGMSQNTAAALVGNASQESSLNPTARNGAYAGLFQFGPKYQKIFAKDFSYQIGASNISARQQFLDQLMFMTLPEMQKYFAKQLAGAHGLAAKTLGFEMGFEKPGDNSYGRRLLYAQSAFETAMEYARTLGAAAAARPAVIHHTTTHHTKIGTVAVSTKATDAEGMAAGARKALSTHPLIGPIAQQQVVLATRGSQ